MAFTPARLCQAVLGTSATDLYTAASRAVLLRQVVIANPSAAAITARFSLIPSGGSADGTHLILPDVSVAAHDLITFDCWQVLAVGDKLNGLASTGAQLVLTASGVLL